MSATHHPSAVTDGEESDANFSGDEQWETSKQNFAKLGGEVSQRPGRDCRALHLSIRPWKLRRPGNRPADDTP